MRILGSGPSNIEKVAKYFLEEEVFFSSSDELTEADEFTEELEFDPWDEQLLKMKSSSVGLTSLQLNLSKRQAPSM